MGTKNKTAANDRLSPKEAASRARAFLDEHSELVGAAGDVRLEEVELSDDGHVWLITLSYSSRASLKVPLPLAPNLLPFERCFKQFIVDAKSGEVRAMHIRQV